MISSYSHSTRERPLVTAILPLKNYHEPFLRMAVCSLFEQTDPDWRLLVVVEPKDLLHFEALLAAELRDPRATLMVNAGRKLAGAINSGMRAAATPFVAIILGDDLWDIRAVEVLGDYIGTFPDTDFFHSARRVVDENGHPISSVYPSCESFSLEDFVQGSPVKHLLCWHRELGLAVGGLDETLNSVGPDDYDFPWIMAERGARFTAVSECLYVYRDHRESFRLTTHLTRQHHQQELDRILAKHGVPSKVRARRIAASTRGYLRQCLYRSPLDRLIKRWLGFDERRGWREPYK